MKALAATLVLALVAAGAEGQYQEAWDDPVAAHNGWTYWDLEYDGGTGLPSDHNRPMDYFSDGGVGGMGSGYVSSPLGALDQALVHTGAAYWPAYPGEDMLTTGFPDIDLSGPAAAISVSIKGAHPPQTPIDLGGGQVRFFIGYWDGKGTVELDDDEQAFYCTEGTFDVGDNVWDETTVVLGGDTDWQTIIKDEYTVDTQPTDLYVNPQQWGFCIWEVALSSHPTGGSLGFDQFRVIPEPASAVLLALGGAALIRRRSTRH